MKVLLDHMKAAINGCRQEKVGLTNRGKSLVGPIYPLVAQQLPWQGQGHATNASGGRGHGSGGGSKGGGLRPPCSPFGSGGRNHRAHGLATCGQGRPESPDLLICFIIFRASPLGRVALTCPWAHRGQAPASSSFGCALCVENWGMDFPPEI